MKLNLAFAKMLVALHSGQQVNYGEFQGGNRKLVKCFIDDGVLDYLVIGTQQKKVFCNDPVNLLHYLKHKFEIPSLEQYILYLEREETLRSDAVKATSDTKFRKVKVLTGFMVNAFGEIPCQLGDRPLIIKPAKGAFVFIADFKNFVIPPAVTVVGVEGHENFRDIERQRDLFNGIQPLFVWRYQNSNAIAEWMQMLPNNYLHYGDFDPKGLHIYISEFRNKIGSEKCNFFVPENLEPLMSTYGERALYDSQEMYLRYLDDNHYPELSEVIG